jgi:hypothetical protein
MPRKPKTSHKRIVKQWVFTSGRQENLRKARRVLGTLIALGKKAIEKESRR